MAPDDLAIIAMHCMTEEGIDHVPVVGEGRLVGIVTRTDLLRANSRRLEHERPQPWWRPHRTAVRRAMSRATVAD